MKEHAARHILARAALMFACHAAMQHAAMRFAMLQTCQAHHQVFTTSNAFLAVMPKDHAFLLSRPPESCTQLPGWLLPAVTAAAASVPLSLAAAKLALGDQFHVQLHRFVPVPLGLNLFLSRRFQGTRK